MRASTTYQGPLAECRSYGATCRTPINNFNYSTRGQNGGLPAIPTGHGGCGAAAEWIPGQLHRHQPAVRHGEPVHNNSGYNNYHSFQAQVTTRPIQGFSGSVNYNWSKNLGLGAITNPVERLRTTRTSADNPGHSIRTNGTIELPFGPNKLLMGNSSVAGSRWWNAGSWG